MRSLEHLVILVALTLASLTGTAAEWEARATGDAAVAVARRQAPVVKSHYVFWGADWKWTSAGLKLDDSAAPATTFSGAVSALGLKIDGTITSPAANRLRCVWHIEAERELTGIIGGGLEFNLVLDSPSLDPDLPDPVLLENNKGWKWEVGRGGPIVVEFDEPIANVYFERGQKQQIRALFLGEHVAKGTQTVTMTVTLPEGG